MLLIVPPAQTAPVAPSPADQQKRLDDAQALLTANMKGGFSFDSKTTYLQAVQHQSGLLKAWDLTEGEAWLPELMRRRNEIRLELAWRLMDSAKMALAFKEVQGIPHLDLREAVHAFFLAAHTGQWKLMTTYGQALLKVTGSLGGFHDQALNDLAIPDYDSIYELVQERGQDLPLQWTLSDHLWRVTNLRVRLRSVEAADARFKPMREQLLDSAKKLGNSEGWIQRTDSPIDFCEIGVVAHWVEGAGQPPLSGFIWQDRILLRGFLGYDQPGDSGKQIQMFDMRPVTGVPGRWLGVNKMEVVTVNAKGQTVPGIVTVWDYQWDLVPEGGK